MTAVKLVLEYCGTDFAGWAAQPGLRTVEGVLSEGLETVLGGSYELSVAGRTDAGVHALGQVASFSLEEREEDLAALGGALNGVLPRDVSVLSVEAVPGGFDARRDARSRTYCYRVLARGVPSPFERDRALWWHRPVDEGALSDCAALLAGTHDFTAFTPTQTEHVRFDREVMRAEWVHDGDLLCFWIEADTFMRHMVRVLVGTMLEVAEGRRTISDFEALLDGALRPRAGETAKAHGLYLASVRYGQLG